MLSFSYSYHAPFINRVQNVITVHRRVAHPFFPSNYTNEGAPSLTPPLGQGWETTNASLSLPLPLPSLEIALQPSYQIINPPKEHTEEVNFQSQSAPKPSRHRHLPAAPTPQGNSHAKCVKKVHKNAIKATSQRPKNRRNLNNMLQIAAQNNTHPPVFAAFCAIPVPNSARKPLAAPHHQAAGTPKLSLSSPKPQRRVPRPSPDFGQRWDTTKASPVFVLALGRVEYLKSATKECAPDLASEIGVSQSLRMRL